MKNHSPLLTQRIPVVFGQYPLSHDMKYKRVKSKRFSPQWLWYIKEPRRYIITGIFEDSIVSVMAAEMQRSCNAQEGNQGEKRAFRLAQVVIGSLERPRVLCPWLQDQLSLAVNCCSQVLSDDFMVSKSLVRTCTERNGSQKGNR